MTTVFLVTLRPILMLSKCIGLIDISYTVVSTGLLVRNEYSRVRHFLEIVRMIVLCTFTYLCWPNFNSAIHILQIIDIIKFWMIIIAARLSTIWTIRYVFIILYVNYSTKFYIRLFVSIVHT
ncbi:Gustatory receptor [Aphis craccivora]|uniref:Gustatory receptor n=1 Tax=Aphis craccivora TaxID=307492 RepID=A0A6G0XKG1_APHCR|nr:Gustatory receptor [Aphis craccivora]